MPLGTEVGLSAGDIVLDDTYSASSRVLYCGHSTQYSHLVKCFERSNSDLLVAKLFVLT